MSGTASAPGGTRTRLKQVAAETVAILESGSYSDAQGATHDIADAVKAAVSGTCWFSEEGLRAMQDPSWGRSDATPAPAFETRIEVTLERTQEAAQRLLRAGADAALLNFASARRVCGGFRSGARAQEEDLARSSALPAVLKQDLVQAKYYRANRRCKSALYLHRVVYTPKCPFFRAGGDALVPPFAPAVVSAPAPNYGAAVPRHADAAEFEAVYARRAAYVLATMRAHGHQRVVLGAWGCGVFRTDPAMAAQVWKTLLQTEFKGTFQHVVFAVYDGAEPGPCAAAFREAFEEASINCGT